MSHIREIAREPHPAGSAANRLVREYILQELESLGMETETQPEGQLENVLGRIPGTLSTDAILLTAHLDSVEGSPGAMDDGSGAAVLLETARALRSSAPLQNTVIFLFTDDEEGGLHGANAFIARHPWAKDVRVVIGFDAGGITGPGVLSACSPRNGWLIRQLAQADAYLTGSSAITALADSGTDFGNAFRPAGFSGCAFDLYWDRRIHTPQDNIENVDLSSLQHQGSHALSLARHFGGLEDLGDPREPDAVYFSVLRLFTVVYSPAWAIALALAGAVLLFTLLAIGLRRGLLAWRGLAYGAALWAGCMVIAPLPGLLLGTWGSGVSLRYYGRLLDQPSQVMPVAAVAVLLDILWYVLARKRLRARPLDLTLGALTPMAAGMLVAAFILPALSFVFTWPLLFSLPACAYRIHGGPPRSNTIVAGIAVLISTAASIIVLGPTIILGLFDQMPPALALMGLLSGIVLPQIELLNPKSEV